MTKEEYRNKMDEFTTSNKFIHRKIVKEGKYFKDRGTNVIYAIEVDSIKEIRELKLKNPVIYLSKNKRVLNKITDIFNLEDWNEKRIENLSGEEFDYIYLRQCNLLGLDKEIRFRDKGEISE